MKKTLLSAAVGTALLLGASAANAGYTSTCTQCTGNFAITGFADANPDVFQILLTNLDGVFDINVPPSGHWSAQRTGRIEIDYTPVNPGPDLISDTGGNWIPLGSGDISTSGITGSHFVYDFNTNTFTSDGTPTTGGSFNASASTLALLLGNLFGPLAGAIGTGTVAVTHALSPNTWQIDISETDVGGTGFSGLFATLDTLPPGNPLGLPAGNRDGRIDGTFFINGAVHVPEPASIALLGLGLAGIGAARRRKTA